MNRPNSKPAAPNLSELQRLVTAVIDGRASREEITTVEAWVDLSQKSLTARERLDVYADGWFMRLEESLAEDFPGVRRQFADDAWETLIRSYLRAAPSTSFTLARAGDQFPAFLAERSGTLRELVDLALFEKAIYKASNARDVEVWDVSELQGFDPEAAGALRFEAQPSVTLIESNSNFIAQHEGDTAVLSNAATFAVVFREGYTSTYRELDASEFSFLKRASEGATLGELAEEFQEENWLEWLTTAASEGLIHPVMK